MVAASTFSLNSGEVLTSRVGVASSSPRTTTSTKVQLSATVYAPKSFCSAPPRSFALSRAAARSSA